MSGRRRLRIGVLVTALALAGCGPDPAPPAGPEHPPERSPGRPNLLLVVIDTCRADALGCYGGPVPTPAIDALAGRGVRFTACSTVAPITLPAHAALMTGRWPFQIGVRDNGLPALAERWETLAERLAGAGYATGAFVGGFPVTRKFGLAQGFARFDDALGAQPGQGYLYPRRPAAPVAQQAGDWIAARAGEDAPWFAWVHFFDPHAPYPAPPEYRGLHPLPYYGAVAYVDAVLGTLLERVRAQSGDRPTLVAVTADHGESLEEHGEPTHTLFLYEATIRVPLVVAPLTGPGWGGRVVADPVPLIDLMPTLVEWAGLPAPTDLPARSLREVIEAGAPVGDRPAYLESYHPWLAYGWAPLFGVRVGEWKYLQAPEPELYHLTTDPGERVNRYAQAPPARAELRAALGGLVGEAGVWPDAGRPRLDDATRRQLQSLGYAVGGGPRKRDRLTDPKRALPWYVAYQEAVAASLRGDPAAGLARVRPLLERDPDNPRFLEYLGETGLATGDLETAARALARLLALQPDDDRAHFLWGTFLSRTGDREGAERAFRRVLALDPHQDRAGNALAQVLIAGGRLEEARRTLERAVAANPSNRKARANLANLLAQMGETEASLARYRALIQSDPDFAPAYLGLGMVAMARGDLETARWALGEAEARGEAGPVLDFHLAQVLEARGDRAEARRRYRAFLAAAPPTFAAQRELAAAALARLENR